MENQDQIQEDILVEAEEQEQVYGLQELLMVVVE